MPILNKLKSRKFWYTFAAGVVVLFSNQLGLDLSIEQMLGFIALVTGYNWTQGKVDAAAASTDAALAATDAAKRAASTA